MTGDAAVQERGVSIDLGRKHYTRGWLERLIDEMAVLGLNALQLHFSESLGFRIESRRHPEVVSSDHLRHADVRALVRRAADRGITVVPALDMPGHLGHVLRAHPELRLPSAAGRDDDNLDIADPAAVAFAYELVDEFVELFGAGPWHLGADEFIDLEDAERTHPALAAAARERFGADAVAADLFRAFVNDLAAHLRERGATSVRAWNDGFYRAEGVVALDPTIDIAYWTRWDRRMAPVARFVEHGHRLLNFNDGYLYYVLGKPDVYPHPSPERIRHEWTPDLFAGGEREPSVLGAYLAVWSDVPDAESEEQVWAGMRGSLAAMAEVMRGPAGQRDRR